MLQKRSEGREVTELSDVEGVDEGEIIKVRGMVEGTLKYMRKPHRCNWVSNNHVR